MPFARLCPCPNRFVCLHGTRHKLSETTTRHSRRTFVLMASSEDTRSSLFKRILSQKATSNRPRELELRDDRDAELQWATENYRTKDES